MSKRGTRTKENAKTNNGLVLSVDEIRTLLGVGRAAAYKLAKSIGVRIGGRRGRLLVSREAFDSWLRGKTAGGAS